MKTAAYICTGCGIGDRLDAKQLAKVAQREGKMALVREHAFLCSDEGVAQIRADIAGEEVTHVMLAACSRRMKAEAFHFPDVAVARATCAKACCGSWPTATRTTRCARRWPTTTCAWPAPN